MIGVAGLLAGCGDDPRSAPTPTPTYSCTPDPTGAPCTAELAAAQAEEAKAYEEAIFVYQEFTKERNRLAMAGGSPTPTLTMEKYATGTYLSDISGFLAAGYSRGVSTTGPMEIARVDGVAYSGKSLQLKSCEDGRSLEVIDRQGRRVGGGTLGAVLLDFRRVNGQWVIISGTSMKDESCQ